MIILACAIAGGLAFLVVAARRDEPGFQQVWRQLLTPRGLQAYELLRLKVAAIGRLSKSTVAIDAARKDGDWVEVARLEGLRRRWARENEEEGKVLSQWRRLLSAIKIPGE